MPFKMIARRGTQLPLARRHGWGGARPGAGRKRKDGSTGPAGVPHRARPPHHERHPVAITLKVRREVWSLRGPRCVPALRRALEQGHLRGSFRVVHFSILSNHLHLIVEAGGARDLSRGVQALEIRMARALNAAMGRTGRVFADRFHLHALRSPTEVARARRYVLDNFAIHLARAGEPRPRTPDPLGSDALASCCAPATTWLLRIGFRRGLVRALDPELLRDG